MYRSGNHNGLTSPVGWREKSVKVLDSGSCPFGDWEVRFFGVFTGSALPSTVRDLGACYGSHLWVMSWHGDGRTPLSTIRTSLVSSGFTGLDHVVAQELDPKWSGRLTDTIVFL